LSEGVCLLDRLATNEVRLNTAELFNSLVLSACHTFGSVCSATHSELLALFAGMRRFVKFLGRLATNEVRLNTAELFDSLALRACHTFGGERQATLSVMLTFFARTRRLRKFFGRLAANKVRFSTAELFDSLALLACNTFGCEPLATHSVIFAPRAGMSGIRFAADYFRLGDAQLLDSLTCCAGQAVGRHGHTAHSVRIALVIISAPLNLLPSLRFASNHIWLGGT